MADPAWPTADARAAKLLIPQLYVDWYGEQTFHSADPSLPFYCVLHYDADLDAVRVCCSNGTDNANFSVQGSSSSGGGSPDNARILDTVHRHDIIGCKLEIQMHSGTSSSSGDTAARATACDPSSNEPASAEPNDTNGRAVLSIYVYPKLDPSNLSWMNWCGVTAYKPKVNDNRNNAVRHSRFDQPVPTVDEHRLKKRFAFSRTFTLAPTEDMGSASRLAQALNRLAQPARSTTEPPPSYLVLVNPMSGPNKNAVQLCDEVIVPMLHQANIDHDVLVTTHPKHATEYAATVTSEQHRNSDSDSEQPRDIAAYDAVITVGGDGIIHEVMQGIYSRPDAKDILHRLKFGIVPCGSANGMAMSLAVASNELCSPVDAMFMICKGITHRLDMSHYETQSKTYLSHLTLTWSIIADIDIESEKVHFLGKLRFDLWGAIRTAFLRTYPARFSYLPFPDGSASAASIVKIDESLLPPLSEPVPENWITIDDSFVMFWATHVSHAAEKTHHAPQCKLEEGYFHILIVRAPISRYRLARILIGLDDGSHASMEKVEWIKCLAYRLEPQSEGSFNDLDGEVVEPGPIQARIMPSTMNTFCNPPYLT